MWQQLTIWAVAVGDFDVRTGASGVQGASCIALVGNADVVMVIRPIPVGGRMALYWGFDGLFRL